MGSALEEFRAGFDGEALLPGDAGYDETRSVWNGDIDRRPALIARCSAPMHVAEAIALARREGVELSVRGGGHNFAGSAVCDDGLMIDLSPMNDVTVDAGARRARCGGGATWAQLDGATQQHGLAVTGGFISHTGVGGLTLGGGMGWLTRKAGLSCDNLVSAEVVLADGQVVRASADQHEDLFWAIRGGGGNFGVVTEFEFALHEVGPLVQLGLFFWGADQGVEALRLSRDIVAGLPEGVGALIAGLSAPPAPFVPQEHQLAPGFALLIGSFGSPEEHAEIVAPVREALAPLFELVTPIPYTELQKMFDEGNPWGTYAYEKALYLDELSDEVIAIFADHVPRKASPLSFVPVFPLDGAYAEVGEDATAFGGSRSARFVFNIAAVCPVPELLEADRAWVRGFWDALRPHASGAGSYVNFMTDIEEDRVRAAYGAAKYDRLARIKADYDPDNVFHLNANIKPLVPTA
jgi:FAD/FMN-containing dehydrogenase